MGIDTTKDFLMSSKEDAFSLITLEREIGEKINSDIYSAADFIQLGRTFSDAFQEEIAFQLYYLAYLKNRELIGTNSDLNLE